MVPQQKLLICRCGSRSEKKNGEDGGWSKMVKTNVRISCFKENSTKYVKICQTCFHQPACDSNVFNTSSRRSKLQFRGCAAAIEEVPVVAEGIDLPKKASNSVELFNEFNFMPGLNMFFLNKKQLRVTMPQQLLASKSTEILPQAPVGLNPTANSREVETSDLSSFHLTRCGLCNSTACNKEKPTGQTLHLNQRVLDKITAPTDSSHEKQVENSVPQRT